MANLFLSNHARGRAQQRGVPAHFIRAILDHHDAEHMVGDNCRALRVSRRAGGDMPPQDRERLSRITIVYSDETQRVVTVLRDRPGRSGRRYRRQF